MKRENMLIEADELLAKIDDPNLRILDATIVFYRKEGEPTGHDKYVEEHIVGAAFYDHEAFSDPNNKYYCMIAPEEALAAQIGASGISNDSEVVVYSSTMLPCATRAWWVLHYAGHKNVRVLNGGLAAWKAAGGQTKSGSNQYPAASFSSNLQPELFASKEDVLAAMNDGAVCTINTLAPENYNKAHITGSALHSCGNLMDEMSTFKSNEQLAARLQEEASHERVITYCGGGFAATVNAMAHLMVGNPNVAVYDGSMSEWTGEGMPLTKGA